MRVLVCLLLALAPLSVPFAHAQTVDSAWAVDYDRFYRIDLATLEATSLGEVGDVGGYHMADLSGLTTTPDGRLYVASDTLKGLIRVDPGSGDGTFVGYFGINSTAPMDFGMTASCQGFLWLASPVTRQLWKVDPSTGNASQVGMMDHSITGLAVYGDKLYGVGGRGEEGWYGIDTETGASSLIGGLGSMVDYITSASPAIGANGQVLAAFNYVPPPKGQLPPDWSDLATIDRDNGATEIVGSITGPQGLQGIGVRGFTLGPPVCATKPMKQGPVPAPTLDEWGRLLLMLAMLAVALAGMRRRARPRR